MAEIDPELVDVYLKEDTYLEVRPKANSKSNTEATTADETMEAEEEPSIGDKQLLTHEPMDPERGVIVHGPLLYCAPIIHRTQTEEEENKSTKSKPV